MILPDDPVATLLDKAGRVIDDAAGATSSATAQASHAIAELVKLMHSADRFAQFWLLPLCLALLIVYEHYRAAIDGAPFRVRHVLVRTGAVVALILGYSKLCGLITGVAGGGSGWMTSNDYLHLFDRGADSLGTAWKNLGGLSDMPKFIGIVIVWVILMISVLFAYISGALLGLIQAVTLSLLVGLGKTCIIMSLVPGVGLGKSWARSLAQVAAWSTVGGVILGLMSHKNVTIAQLIVSGDMLPLLKASAHFIILALMTLAVPLITAKLFSGGAAGLGEVMVGLGAAAAFGRMGMNAVRKRDQQKQQTRGYKQEGEGGDPKDRGSPQNGGSRPQGGGGGDGFARRVHKLPWKHQNERKPRPSPPPPPPAASKSAPTAIIRRQPQSLDDAAPTHPRPRPMDDADTLKTATRPNTTESTP
jgi:hypothetical protein